MERYLLQIFFVNWLLVLCDAALGYHMAPFLGRIGVDEASPPVMAVSTIRRLLVMAVAIYMFFNCLAYFKGSPVIILIVTGIVVLDIVFQILVRWNMMRKSH